ncbi:MAG TPA: hypothetical protein VF434_08220, partial [Promineifilum sp.]
IDGIVAGIRAGFGAVMDAINGLIDAVLGKAGGTKGIVIGGKFLPGGKVGSFAMVGTGGGVGGGSTSTTIINIDARGAQRGTERDIRRVVEDVMRQEGRKANIRIRTGV